MKKSAILFFSLLFISKFFAQTLYISSLENKLYRLDINNCTYEFVVTVQEQVYDISFHPNGQLYGISGVGAFYEINILTGNTTIIHEFFGQDFNSLIIGADELVYTTGTNGELWSYDISSGIEIYHGFIGYGASGDLTFYEGELYAAVFGGKILHLDIDNPSNSNVIIDDNFVENIFGIVSFVEDCNHVSTYALTDGNSHIYEIDFEDNSLQYICEIDIEVGGGASLLEFIASSPIVIEEIETLQPNCDIGSGAILIDAVGGVGELTYSLNGTVFQTSNFFDNLMEGMYVVMISDENNCILMEELELSAPAIPEIVTLAFNNASCENNNGSITVVGTGGTGQLTYSIDGVNFQASNIFNNLPEGSYSITLRDINNCTDMGSVDIQFQGSPQITALSTFDLTCEDDNASIMVSAIGGGGQIAYAIDGINFQANNTFNNLLAGNYIITIQDDNGCIDTENVEILPVSLPQITALSTLDLTCENDNASITVLAIGGTGQLVYAIDGINFQLNNTFDNLLAGNYTVIVHDDNGCADTENVEILPENAPQITALSSNHLTCGEINGSITATALGGVGQLAYSIDGINFQATGFFEDLNEGTYVLTVQDESSCFDTQTIIINTSGFSFPQLIETVSTSCDDINGVVNILANGSVGMFAFSINGIDYQESNVFSDLIAGEYEVYIKDENDCISIKDVTLLVPEPLIIQNIEVIPALCGESDGEVLIEIEGGAGQLQASLNGSGFQPNLIFDNLLAGAYQFVFSDEIGCKIDTLLIVDSKKCPLFIPNAFSPNNDGFNDLFKIYPHLAFNGDFLNFKIFNRWGALIYEVFDFNPENTGWDGSFKGKKMGNGVYVYYVEVLLNNGETIILAGDVVLVK